ncbi:MAG: bifunctional UDP-sugar hydrolase/5'-nucleotidase [Halobacteriales archaeon]
MAVRLLQYSDIESAHDRPERIGRLAGLLADLRDEHTLVVGTGDDTAPGVLSLVTEGRQALEFFSRVEPDLETVGNHDLDHGLDAIREVVTDSPQTWVATNVYRGDPPAIPDAAEYADRFGADACVVPTAVREVDGTRIGMFGVLDPATPELTPPAAELSVTDPVETAERAIEDLRARGVDQVVALSHVGRGDDDIARETDVDVVLGGHVHETRLEEIAGTLLTRPGANARWLVELQFAAGEWTGVRHDVTEAPIDRDVERAYRNQFAVADLDSVVGSLDDPIERSADVVRGGPCRVGRLVAEAYRGATGADVGLQNTSGIKFGPPLSGSVTAADLVALTPFRDPVAVFELSGRNLRSVLAERDGANVSSAPDGRWMGHVSGVEATTEEDQYLVGGESLDPDGTYTLATSDYLRRANGEFPALSGLEPVELTEQTQYEVLVEYVREHGRLS